jgi:hypothetical protein
VQQSGERGVERPQVTQKVAQRLICTRGGKASRAGKAEVDGLIRLLWLQRHGSQPSQQLAHSTGGQQSQGGMENARTCGAIA